MANCSVCQSRLKSPSYRLAGREACSLSCLDLVVAQLPEVEQGVFALRCDACGEPLAKGPCIPCLIASQTDPQPQPTRIVTCPCGGHWQVLASYTGPAVCVACGEVQLIGPLLAAS